MYPNLKAEMARNNITMTKLAEVLDRTTGTISGKLKGNYPFTLDEAKRIKAVLQTDLSLEELFKTEG